MTKQKRYNLPEELDLDFPDDPGFVSEKPIFSASQMIAMCEEMLPFWNKRRFVDGDDIQPCPIDEPFYL